MERGELLENITDLDIENSKSPLDLKFSPLLADRFPRKDPSDAFVPDEIMLFCFPDGVTLKVEETEPTFFHSVLTNSQVRCIIEVTIMLNMFLNYL